MTKLRLVALFTLIYCQNLVAADTSMDFMRSTGKIYAVIAVLVVIILGIGYFLIKMDRKISKLEKQINNDK